MALRKVRFKKYLYAIFFEKGKGRILLIDDGQWLSLPGGEVLWEHIHKCIDERWKREFFCRVVPDQTDIAAYFIEAEVQPIPATYEVYYPSLEEEFSAIIVGEIDPFIISEEKRKFYSVEDIVDLARRRKIKRNQMILAYRAFASRDCHNSKFNKEAALLLKQEHK